MKAKIFISAIIIVAFFVGVATIHAWYTGMFPKVINQWLPAPPIKTVEKIKKVTVPGPTQIVTIEKQVVVEKLKLPDWIKNDADEQVIATAKIPAYDGDTDAAALLNTKTGIGEIIAKQEPLSLFSLESKAEIGGKVGWNTDGKNVLKGYGKWDFLRFEKFHLGVYGEGYTDFTGTVKGDAGATVSRKW